MTDGGHQPKHRWRVTLEFICRHCVDWRPLMAPEDYVPKLLWCPACRRYTDQGETTLRTIDIGDA